MQCIFKYMQLHMPPCIPLYIERIRMSGEDTKTGKSYAKLRTQIIRFLKDGPIPQPVLVKHFEAQGWTRNEVTFSLSNIGALTWRGNRAYHAGLLVYHPNDPNITDEMRPPVELWLRDDIFATRKRVWSTKLVEASIAKGFKKWEFERAKVRLGLKSVKKGDDYVTVRWDC